MGACSRSRRSFPRSSGDGRQSARRRRLFDERDRLLRRHDPWQSRRARTRSGGPIRRLGSPGRRLRCPSELRRRSETPRIPRDGRREMPEPGSVRRIQTDAREAAATNRLDGSAQAYERCSRSWRRARDPPESDPVWVQARVANLDGARERASGSSRDRSMAETRPVPARSEYQRSCDAYRTNREQSPLSAGSVWRGQDHGVGSHGLQKRQVLCGVSEDLQGALPELDSTRNGGTSRDSVAARNGPVVRAPPSGHARTTADGRARGRRSTRRDGR